VWSGSPAAAIVKAADLIDAELIVMARSGRTGAPRQLLGSVVERVLRGTSCPVLVVTPADACVDASLCDATPVPVGAARAAGSAGPVAGRRWPSGNSKQASQRVPVTEPRLPKLRARRLRPGRRTGGSGGDSRRGPGR
jgi:hypothetical protein